MAVWSMSMCVMESSSYWEISKVMVARAIILRRNQLIPCFSTLDLGVFWREWERIYQCENSISIVGESLVLSLALGSWKNRPLKGNRFNHNPCSGQIFKCNFRGGSHVFLYTNRVASISHTKWSRVSLQRCRR